MCLSMPSIAVRKGGCQMLALNRFSVQKWLKSFDSIIFDADGVLWHRERPLDGATETFNAIRAMGKQPFICTNYSASSNAALCSKAQNMGLMVSSDEILSSSMALARYLQERKFKRKVFIVGGQGIADELKAVGIQSLQLTNDLPLNTKIEEFAEHIELDAQVGAVAVGVDNDFNMFKLTKACCYLKDPNVLFLATNRDRAYRLDPNDPARYTPGAGVMVATVQAATKRVPFTCGKPNTHICLHLLRQGIIKPQRTLMVGDTMYTDIQFGYNCGFQTLLVGTGCNSYQDVLELEASKDPHAYQQVPDLFVPKLSDLLKFLPSRNR